MKQYEYKIVSAAMKGVMKMNIDLEATEAILTGLGLAGWELVNSYAYTKASNGMPEHLYVLRREVVNEDLV